MRRQIHYISVPVHIWEHADLSMLEKFVLMDIDSYRSSDGGAIIGAQSLSSSLGVPVRSIKDALKTLQAKGAIEIRIGENGEKKIIPYLWKERYIENPHAVIVGDKPSDIQVLPYDEIAEKWAEICVTLPKIARWTPQRKNKVKSALKQAALSVEDLYKVFRIIACTPFLNGEGDFKAHFDWVVSKSVNLQKIYEGFYSRSYSEKSSYERIMNGVEVNQKKDETEDFYK